VPLGYVISGQSGLIHYTEGRVFLNDQLIEPKFGEFPQLKNADTVGLLMEAATGLPTRRFGPTGN